MGRPRQNREPVCSSPLRERCKWKNLRRNGYVPGAGMPKHRDRSHQNPPSDSRGVAASLRKQPLALDCRSGHGAPPEAVPARATANLVAAQRVLYCGRRCCPGRCCNPVRRQHPLTPRFQPQQRPNTGADTASTESIGAVAMGWAARSTWRGCLAVSSAGISKWSAESFSPRDRRHPDSEGAPKRLQSSPSDGISAASSDGRIVPRTHLMARPSGHRRPVQAHQRCPGETAMRCPEATVLGCRCLPPHEHVYKVYESETPWMH
jgi:hypothetical protein